MDGIRYPVNETRQNRNQEVFHPTCYEGMKMQTDRDIIRLHHRFMDEAVREAKDSMAEGGIPIGSVLVRRGDIIGRGHNRRIQEQDPVRHAEIDCLSRAGRIGSYQGCTLYSTLMPCYLCAGAVVQFRISLVVAGESRNFAGAREFMESQGVPVIDLDRDDCIEMMRVFIEKNPVLWNEDIGEL
jgi:creatinine deaminase